MFEIRWQECKVNIILPIHDLLHRISLYNKSVDGADHFKYVQKRSSKCIEWAVVDRRHGAIGGGQKRLRGKTVPFYEMLGRT